MLPMLPLFIMLFVFLLLSLSLLLYVVVLRDVVGDIEGIASVEVDTDDVML